MGWKKMSHLSAFRPRRALESRVAEAVDARLRGFGIDPANVEMLHRVAENLRMAPAEVLRRGVTFFKIAAEAERNGNTLAVLDKQNTVVAEWTDISSAAPVAAAPPTAG